MRSIFQFILALNMADINAACLRYTDLVFPIGMFGRMRILPASIMSRRFQKRFIHRDNEPYWNPFHAQHP